MRHYVTDLVAAIAMAALAVTGNTVVAAEANSTTNLVAWNPSPAQADFYVACDGKDSNPGTAAAPFATLAKVRDAVRAKVAPGLTSNVLVLIRGGVYSQTETLTFGPDDSGTANHSITYAAAPGEMVVLSGGRKISGWKKGAGEIWTAEVPQVKAGKWCFRQLFVNGRRAIRARTPNVDDKDPWWSIKSGNFGKDNPAPPDVPVVLSVSGRIADYGNPTDIEFVHICNNDMGRKRLAGLSTAAQTLTLATPNRWNPRAFQCDWYLSIPTAGGQGQVANRCYLENALEMLDQPGEWYLDRKTGRLSYWPRSGEDLTKADIIAPAAQNTLLALVGTPDRPVRNVHVRGVRCEYVDWSPPPWGYMGLFCCNIAVHRQPNPGHRFIDAAVEYFHARECSFRDGGVAHVGAMGVCLREGTSRITIEGNEIADLGGGGIGLGGCNVAAGYTKAAPPPQPGQYTGYRIANNHVHHCGTDYYGAVGIALFLAQDSVIAHNFIHDTAYFGMGVAGSQAGSTPFAGDNRIEYNHIHDAMKVTVDGAAMYITFAHGGRGTLVRGNLIHDTAPGKGGVPSAGLYLDGNCSGGRFEQNVVYRNNAAGPLIFNFPNARKTNVWIDNLFLRTGSPPDAFIEAVEACAGLEPAYRTKLLKTDRNSWARYMLGDSSEQATWSAVQFDLPAEGRGVVQVMVREGNKDDVVRFKLRELDRAAPYELRAYNSPMAPTNVWGAGQMPMLGTVGPADLAALGVAERAAGRDLLTHGLSLKLGKSPQLVWIEYRKAAAFKPAGISVNGLAAEPAPSLTVTSIDDTDVSAIWRSGSGWQDFSGLGKTHYKGTAMSSQQPGDAFVCGNSACTRIRWFATKSTDRGMADVYVDGVLKWTVDMYAPRLQESQAVFDTGVLPLGSHKLRVVVKAARNAATRGSWVECDKIEVTHEITKSQGTASTNPNFVAPYDRRVLYFGKWEHGRLPSAEPVCQADRPRSACVLVFKGPAARWLGGKGPDHGLADVYIDQQLVQTVEAYAPTGEVAQVLFEKTGLSTQRMHTLRIEVRQDRNPKATGNVQEIHGFEVSEALDYPRIIRLAAEAELKAIAAGTKPYLVPETWKPVAYAATAPAKEVTLEAGPLRDCFDRNIACLNHCFAAPNGTYCDSKSVEGFWLVDLPGSSEGRMLGGAAHTLRWGERADMRAIVDTFVNRVKSRQTADGWCLPYPIAEITKSERSNYDRVGLTRGLIAAGMVGNPDAYAVLRRFYDWFNPSPYQATLLRGSNCNNGHEGGLLMYFSPVGKKEDLVAVERYFVQDFFLEQAANAEPLALDYYPLHTPHSYVILAFQAWLDHYRATGAAKYLNAAKGAWQIVNGSYEHVGGTMAICEEPAGAYPPKSYYLGKHTGETCGSVFWADFNHRFLQLFPAQAKYADEIETVIYNVVLACQDAKGSIRYHNNLHGNKDGAACVNTCCEVMGVPFIARLPQYVYSVADDGLYVNLFAASTITWSHGGQSVALKTETAYPYNGKVAIKLTAAAPTRMKLRIRIPSWVDGKVPINVNGAVAATGTPGSYAEIERSWSNNDAITLDFPMAFRVLKYTGLDQDAHNDRYALLYGPVLMALVGGTDLDLPSNELPNRLLPIAGNPLHFGVAKHPGCIYLPYWQVQAEKFTCFPTMRNLVGTGPIDGRH